MFLFHTLINLYLLHDDFSFLISPSALLSLEVSAIALDVMAFTLVIRVFFTPLSVLLTSNWSASAVESRGILTAQCITGFMDLTRGQDEEHVWHQHTLFVAVK